MKNDCHLVISEDALPENVSHEGLCGKVVHNAAYAMVWSETAMGKDLLWNALDFSNTCRACRQKLSDLSINRRIKLYAFYDAAQRKDNSSENHDQ